MKTGPSACEPPPSIDGERRRWSPPGGTGPTCLYVAERGHGRPVVLVHDLRATSSAYEIRPLFECLRWRRPTYALDLPGFGLSSKDARPYTPALYAGVVGELLRRLRRREPAADVVALGRGAQLAAGVARDDPDLVRSLVLLEPAGLLPSRATALEKVAARTASALGDSAARAVFTALAARPLVRRAIASRFHGAPDEGLVSHAHATARAPGAHRAPLALMAARASEADADLYRAVSVPVLVVHDVSGPGATALEWFLRGRANRFAVRVSPTRGMPHFERRIQTLAAVDRFWQVLPSAASDQAAP